ncbi:MAG TPA: FAD:protein FMN transferase [Acidimicrobiia bacterium]|nr:FAD:protein FMN transferase [Acidimicrobiia bacterium]
MDRRTSERFFRAMGSAAHVIVVGGAADLAATAVDRLADLEARWSRFLPDSELSRLNRIGGGLVVVSPETYLAVELAVRAWRTTGGLYDPTILPALVGAGYDRSFEQLTGAPNGSPPPPAAGPAAGCGAIELLPALGGVVLPADVSLDLGGIGKGLAADLVVTDLMASGAAGACVNLGGDLRLAGVAPTDDGWVIGIEDPWDPGSDRCRVTLTSGAVATSTTAKRRWHAGGEEKHHLIDPRTGRSARSGVCAATVVAGEAWRAEVLAKACLLDPAAAGELLAASAAAGLLLTDEAEAITLGEFERYEA